MTTLTIDLPADVYERLRAVASQQGKQVEEIAQKWLVEHSIHAHMDLPPPAPPGERERAIAVLRDAGLLAESGPELKARAARSTLTMEEARAILDRAGDKPLSEIIIEMRGPKE
jgi:plasmid stability protein